MADYIEEDCAIVGPDGQIHVSGGSVITADHVIGYVKADREYVGAPVTITNWHGDMVIGHGVITARWRRSSYVSSHLCQIRAIIDGRPYTGRSAGNGMIWKGKASN